MLHVGSQFPDQPGIEPMPPAMEVQSRNHWAAREVPKIYSFKRINDELSYISIKLFLFLIKGLYKMNYAEMATIHSLDCEPF